MIRVEIVHYLQAVVRYIGDSGVWETKARRAGLETEGGLYAVCRAYAPMSTARVGANIWSLSTTYTAIVVRGAQMIWHLDFGHLRRLALRPWILVSPVKMPLCPVGDSYRFCMSEAVNYHSDQR
jgi:hypothetical protein